MQWVFLCLKCVGFFFFFCPLILAIFKYIAVDYLVNSYNPLESRNALLCPWRASSRCSDLLICPLTKGRFSFRVVFVTEFFFFQFHSLDIAYTPQLNKKALIYIKTFHHRKKSMNIRESTHQVTVKKWRMLQCMNLHLLKYISG